MFDFRYHVASLAAVFIALVIGILVGVGLSGKGFVGDAERRNLTREISGLKAERDAARSLVGLSNRRERAMQEFAADTYPVLVPARLKDMRVGVLYVGSVDQTVDFAVAGAVRDAGGTVVRMRAIGVPLDAKAVADTVGRRPALRSYDGVDHLDDLGRELGREFVAGGKTPLWDALDETIVEEREGPSRQPLDGVVVVRPAPPQRAATKQVLAGLYRGIARSGVPAVGVERAASERSAMPVFQAAGLSTVDSIETPAGRLALVLVLGGGKPGDYGVEATARDGALPPLTPLPVPQG